MIRSQPVLWWELINDANAVSEHLGWGLAGVWSLIHRGDYAAARARVDELIGWITEIEPVMWQAALVHRGSGSIADMPEPPAARRPRGARATSSNSTAQSAQEGPQS